MFSSRGRRLPSWNINSLKKMEGMSFCSLRRKIYVFTKPAATGKLSLCAFLIIIQLHDYFKEHKNANTKQGLLGIHTPFEEQYF